MRAAPNIYFVIILQVVLLTSFQIPNTVHEPSAPEPYISLYIAPIGKAPLYAGLFSVDKLNAIIEIAEAGGLANGATYIKTVSVNANTVYIVVSMGDMARNQISPARQLAPT